MKHIQVCISTVFILGLIAGMPQVGARSLRVRIDRWLEVQQLTGNVMLLSGNLSQTARIGMRLQQVGDTITTGKHSSTTLAVDTGMGFVQVASNTMLRVQQMQDNPAGGRLTRLQVMKGQARFQVKGLKESGSELEIETPAGSSAVRGTEFGVSVHPDGKTGIITLEGSVMTSAQGKSVLVEAGYQSVLIPGEPPTDPTPAKDRPDLNLRFLAEQANRTVHVVGQVDPVNLVVIDETQQVIDRNGRFEVVVPLPIDRRINVTVITPSGKRELYELAVP